MSDYNEMSDEERDELATYAAAKLADAALPIVENWPARGSGRPRLFPSAEQLDSLARALADLFSTMHPDVDADRLSDLIERQRLEGAAPQLLAACEEAMSLLSNTLDFDALVSEETDAVVALQEAIAAARGGQA